MLIGLYLALQNPCPVHWYVILAFHALYGKDASLWDCPDFENTCNESQDRPMLKQTIFIRKSRLRFSGANPFCGESGFVLKLFNGAGGHRRNHRACDRTYGQQITFRSPRGREKKGKTVPSLSPLHATLLIWTPRMYRTGLLSAYSSVSWSVQSLVLHIVAI